MASSDLDREFGEAQKQAQEGEKARRDAAKQADDRSHIAKAIIWAFIGLMTVVVISIIAGSYLLEWNKIVDPAKFLMDILGSIMLPVVTLVIGYYFGKK